MPMLSTISLLTHVSDGAGWPAVDTSMLLSILYRFACSKIFRSKLQQDTAVNDPAPVPLVLQRSKATVGS